LDELIAPLSADEYTAHITDSLTYGTSITSLNRGTQTSTNNLTATEIMLRQQSYATTSSVRTNQGVTVGFLQQATGEY
jgi:hypothetical protein